MLPAQQVYSAEFDRLFFHLPSRKQAEIQARIDLVGTHLKEFRHQRLQGIEAFKLRVGDYRIIYQFDLERSILYLITLGHRREIYRGLKD
jgi:mRNA interferase RelE/StbE